MLYRPVSEYSGLVSDYANDFNRRHPKNELELVDVDSRSGTEIAKLYGVVRYPALLVMGDDGSAIDMWQGTPLPASSEVDFYLR